MNRTRLKNYAPEARRQFIQAMTDRAAFYGLTAAKIEPVVERGDVALILGREVPLAVSRQRQKLAERIKLEGFAHTIEALAYTWFNRLVAIRYMELRGYLDHGYRVLSHPEGKPTPEILQHAEHVELQIRADVVERFGVALSLFEEQLLFRDVVAPQDGLHLLEGLGREPLQIAHLAEGILNEVFEGLRQCGRRCRRLHLEELPCREVLARREHFADQRGQKDEGEQTGGDEAEERVQRA